MNVILEAMPFNCAEKLTGQGVDRQLLTAGFPELVSINPDGTVDFLEELPLLGDHRYFVKNNERILGFLQREEKNKWFFMRLFQNMDR